MTTIEHIEMALDHLRRAHMKAHRHNSAKVADACARLENLLAEI